MNPAVVSFPGTNCDHDVEVLVQSVTGKRAKKVWCTERELPGATDLLFIPGGFSYGDYLRCGAMAKVAPVASAIRKFAESGGTVIGICNGFQILCELGLLPGVLLPNRTTRFLSRPVHIQVDSTDSVITKHLEKGEVFTVPISHFEGNYFAAEDALQKLEDNNQVIFRYCSDAGEVDPGSVETNPNGSIHSIAGVRNETGNVVGFMPHPERIVDPAMDPSGKGRAFRFFEGILAKAA